MSKPPRTPRLRRRAGPSFTTLRTRRTAPPVAPLIVDSYARLNLRLRARMLGHLLQLCGSLALAVIGGGAFAKYLTQSSWPQIQVSLQDAARATASQVMDVVRYVQQSNPQQLERWAAEIARLSGSPGRLQLSFD